MTPSSWRQHQGEITVRDLDFFSVVEVGVFLERREGLTDLGRKGLDRGGFLLG